GACDGALPFQLTTCHCGRLIAMRQAALKLTLGAPGRPPVSALRPAQRRPGRLEPRPANPALRRTSSLTRPTDTRDPREPHSDPHLGGLMSESVEQLQKTSAASLQEGEPDVAQSASSDWLGGP